VKRLEPAPENEVFVKLAPAKCELPRPVLSRFVLLYALFVAYELARADRFPVLGRAEGSLSANASARFTSRPLPTAVREVEVTLFPDRFMSVESPRPNP